MNSNFITRSKIDHIVEHKIDEMSKDPKSTLESLEAMIHRFSFSRFQIPAFSIVDHLLANHDSAYYFMIQRILHQTSHSAIKNLGILLGYNSWTYGAKLLRTESKKSGYCIPWNIIFRWNPSCTDQINLENIRQFVAEGNKLGIYTFTIRQISCGPIPGELFDLCSNHPDTLFFWMLPDQPLAPIHFRMIEANQNILVFFQGNAHHTERNVRFLKQHHALYGIYYPYSADDESYLFSDQFCEYFPYYDAPFVTMIADDSCPNSIKSHFAKYTYSTRLQQNLPFILLDFYSDLIRINHLITEQDCLMEFDTDGSLIYPSPDKPSIDSAYMLNLNWYLASCMPPLLQNNLKNQWKHPL